ncbi:MAG: AraC family transcriptional regulator [Candidatus Cryptobacteroides sp.]
MDEYLDIIELSDYFSTGRKQEIDMLVIGLVESGFGTIEVEGRKFPIRTNDLIVCPPGVVTGGINKSRTCQMISIGLSYSHILGSLSSGRSIWSIMTYAKDNPVYHLNEKELGITRSYYNILKLKFSTGKDFFYNEIVQTLLSCIIYEVCTVISRSVAPGEKDNTMSHKDLIFKKFVEMLANGNYRQRKVSTYARELCVTPKYLSDVTRSISGKPALELILENATRGIAMDLEYSTKSIKEIAAEYDFPNVSVFGKFVRSRLGVSPREYRKRGAGKKEKDGR